MKRPATVIIRDDQGEVVYMQFIDMAFIEVYKTELDKMAASVVILETDSGETFYKMPDYVQNLLRKGRKND